MSCVAAAANPHRSYGLPAGISLPARAPPSIDPQTVFFSVSIRNNKTNATSSGSNNKKTGDSGRNPFIKPFFPLLLGFVVVVSFVNFITRPADREAPIPRLNGQRRLGQHNGLVTKFIQSRFFFLLLCIIARP